MLNMDKQAIVGLLDRIVERCDALLQLELFSPAQRE